MPMKLLKVLLTCVLALAIVPAFAQGKPATDNMQILRDKLKADKLLGLQAGYTYEVSWSYK